MSPKLLVRIYDLGEPLDICMVHVVFQRQIDNLLEKLDPGSSQADTTWNGYQTTSLGAVESVFHQFDF